MTAAVASRRLRRRLAKFSPWHGLVLATKGIVAGIVVAAGLGRLLQVIMPDVSPLDPLVLVSVALLLLATALVTCLLPARKATRIQPILALKCE